MPMNTIRNLYPIEVEELKVILRTVYQEILSYQEDRIQNNEIKMREAVKSTLPYLNLFKTHIPKYKQRYIELLEKQEELKAYDLIICFDRAIYELHARVEAGIFADLPWSKELRDLLNERQNTTGVEMTRNESVVEYITSGVSVSRGVVEGIARVILDEANISKLNQGDILVTSMTAPNFVPYARIVSGLVTDKGGLVCHAAILAREFNLPCVVGCKDATKTIQDGERIRLDADTGIVVRLTR